MNPFFDLIILLFLISSINLSILVFRDTKKSDKWEYRNKKIAKTISILLFLSFLVISWGSFIEPRIITTNNVSIDLESFNPEKPIKIAFISDVHVGTYKKSRWVNKISSHIKKLNPDIILMGGDFIVDKEDQTKYLSSFSALAEQFPTYAVLGDHDYRTRIKDGKIIRVDEDSASAVFKTMEKAGIEVLRNELVEIKINNNNLNLLGLDDWLAGKTRIRPSDTADIILIHNPDFILRPESKNAALILSGNTHGGQIRLPLIGPVPPLPSALPKSFDEGLFTLENNTKLFISSGISESGPRARLFNPPEIALLELF